MPESPSISLQPGHYPHLRKSLYWILLGLGLVLLLSTFWKKGRLGDNARSRFITVERLVERNTWAHIAPGDTTPFPPSIDVIKMGDRIYSSKPPNYPLLMAGEAKLLKWVTGWDFYAHRKDYNRFLVILNQVLPYLLMLWVAMLFLAEFTNDAWTQHFMLLAMSLGLIAFGYAPEINNHSPASALLLILVYLTYRIWIGKEQRSWTVILLGLGLGYLVTLELPALAFGLILLAMVLRKNWRWGLVMLVTMVLPIIPTMLVYHEISGAWKPFYLQGNLYRYEGSYWSKPQASDALLEPQGLYFLKTLFGLKGLFVVSPVLLLPIAGLLPSIRRRREAWFPMMSWIALGLVAIVLYIGLRTHNYGGDCIGMRWYIVFMPLLMFCAWPMVEYLGTSKWGRSLAVLLLLISMVQNVVALYLDCFIDITKL